MNELNRELRDRIYASNAENINKQPQVGCRERIIKVLDEEDCWEHVIMNYLAYSPMKISDVGNNKDTRRIHRKLNDAIDNIMQSYEMRRNG